MICSLYLRCDRCSHVVRIEGSVKREDHSQYFSKQAQEKEKRRSFSIFFQTGSIRVKRTNLICCLWNVAPVRQTMNNLDDVAVLDPVDWLLTIIQTCILKITTVIIFILNMSLFVILVINT